MKIWPVCCKRISYGVYMPRPWLERLAFETANYASMNVRLITYYPHHGLLSGLWHIFRVN